MICLSGIVCDSNCESIASALAPHAFAIFLMWPRAYAGPPHVLKLSRSKSSITLSGIEYVWKVRQ